MFAETKPHLAWRCPSLPDCAMPLSAFVKEIAMCSMILLALNTFLATPGCVAPDGPATLAAQQWTSYTLGADGYNAVVPIYEEFPSVNRVVAGSVAYGPDAYFGFTWFGESMTLVVEATPFEPGV
jgi:hypothetical protein